MTAVATYHPAGIAKAGRHGAWQAQPSAIGHSPSGQTYPMRYLGGGWCSNSYRPLFRRIRRRFAVFPA